MTIKLHDEADMLAMYLDWFNNFLTIPRFAEYYGITESFAEHVIREGRKVLDRQLYGGSKLYQQVPVTVKG